MEGAVLVAFGLCLLTELSEVLCCLGDVVVVELEDDSTDLLAADIDIKEC